MKYTLTNNSLSVTVNSLGAEIVSVVKDGREYIWQGGEEGLWSEHAPILFPICGRLPDGVYSHKGRKYQLGTHGFARFKEFTPISVNKNEISLLLIADVESMAVFPFDFELTVTYRLDGDRITQSALIKNKGNEMLYVGYGAHPGFALDGELSDHYIDFGQCSEPLRIGLTERGLQSGERYPFALEDHRIMRLSDEIIGNAGIFLAETSRHATLRSVRSEHGVELSFPDMPYVGFWHDLSPCEKYICIEPWCSLPSLDRDAETLEAKSDMFGLSPDACRSAEFTIRFF